MEPTAPTRTPEIGAPLSAAVVALAEILPFVTSAIVARNRIEVGATQVVAFLASAGEHEVTSGSRREMASVITKFRIVVPHQMIRPLHVATHDDPLGILLKDRLLVLCWSNIEFGSESRLGDLLSRNCCPIIFDFLNVLLSKRIWYVRKGIANSCVRLPKGD